MVTARQVGPSVTPDPKSDYTDRFVIATNGVERSAREWAAASLSGADAAGGLFSRLAWQGALGFRLAPRGGAATLMGWTVSSETPRHIVLAADGSRMAGRMTFQAEEGEVRWSTALRFHNSAGRRVWRLAGYLHRALAPRCLLQARARLGD